MEVIDCEVRNRVDAQAWTADALDKDSIYRSPGDAVLSTIDAMLFARSTVSRQGRWITSVLVAVMLLMQFALAAYACPKLDSAAHAASMQKAGMVMEDAVGMPSMPDCHAMAGTMDEQDPQLCRAHCDGDSLSSPSLQGLDLQALAAHAIWVAYVLPVILDSERHIDPRAVYAELDSRAGSPPIYLTHQVFRN